jgi:hypothetical protein
MIDRHKSIDGFIFFNSKTVNPVPVNPLTDSKNELINEKCVSIVKFNALIKDTTIHEAIATIAASKEVSDSVSIFEVIYPADIKNTPEIINDMLILSLYNKSTNGIINIINPITAQTPKIAFIMPYKFRGICSLNLKQIYTLSKIILRQVKHWQNL